MYQSPRYPYSYFSEGLKLKKLRCEDVFSLYLKWKFRECTFQLIIKNQSPETVLRERRLQIFSKIRKKSTYAGASL